MVLKLDGLFHISDRSFGFDFSIELGYLSQTSTDDIYSI